MYQRNDYIMRQISILSQFLTHVLFKEKPQEINITKGELETSMILENQLQTMLDQGEINEAENLLFEKIEAHESEGNLKAAIYFYTALLKMPPEVLKANNYTEDEIEEGLEAIREIYGIIDDLTI